LRSASIRLSDLWRRARRAMMPSASIAADIDPSVVKRERKRAAKIATGNTFEALAREWHENWKDARSPHYAGRSSGVWRPMLSQRSVGGRIAALEPP
jgi:hypothetical protein